MKRNIERDRATPSLRERSERFGRGGHARSGEAASTRPGVGSPARTPGARLWTIARLAVVTIFFTAAPTAGDIGSCGQAPDELDPVKFYTAKESADCQKCHECGLTSEACVHACEPALDTTDFPVNCFPLVHDGEVCLHALQASSCDDYRLFMADVAPTIPTECNFCPPCDRDGGAPADGGPALPRCE